MSPANRVTKLRGDELPVTDEMRAQAFWLVRRYSSLAYIERMVVLFARFLEGYEAYARADPQGDAAWYRETFGTLFTHQAELEKGVELLRQGYASGYGYVVAGLMAGDYLTSRRFTDPPEFMEAIGKRDPPQSATGLFAWADRAIRMSGKVEFTLLAQWAFPRILDPFFGPHRFPERLEPLPARKPTKVRPGDEVPASGVWQPLDVPNGCPNYLWAGRKAPSAQRLAERVERPAVPAGQWTPAKPPRTTYGYEPTPTSWQLLWEDTRYQGGQIPDESAYLDETCAFA